MLLTPSNFHRAGGFASWLHLCCCGCPDSVDITFSGLETLLCPTWASLAIDGTYNIPFLDTVSGGLYRRYRARTGGSVSATNTSGCVYDDSAPFGLGVARLDVFLFASDCSVRYVQVVLDRVSGSCPQTSAAAFEVTPFAEGVVVLGDTINNGQSCGGSSISENGTAVVNAP